MHFAVATYALLINIDLGAHRGVHFGCLGKRCVDCRRFAGARLPDINAVGAILSKVCSANSVVPI